MRGEHPNLLEEFIGDGGASVVGDTMARGNRRRGRGVRRRDALGNPVAKATLASIAAIGFKKLADGR
jgi:hypothetical protein